MSRSRRENEQRKKKQAKAARKRDREGKRTFDERMAFLRNARAAGLPPELYKLHKALG